MFASCTSNKGLITRIYREFKKLNSYRINKPMKQWAKEIKKQLSKEVMQIANKHMKKCSSCLAIKEMLSKLH
jgi:hypothetical protein